MDEVASDGTVDRLMRPIILDEWHVTVHTAGHVGGAEAGRIRRAVTVTLKRCTKELVAKLPAGTNVDLSQ